MESSAELKEVILRFYEALASGGLAALDCLLSRREGILAIGTDPKEWWADYPTLRQVFQAQMAEMGGGVPVVAGDPQAYREGSVGWAADRPTFKLPDGTELPFRLTAVLHQEDGRWKVVQSHASIGVPNAEAVGQELTT